MKNLVKLIAVCFITFQAQAQKVIEKEISTSANKVRVEFKFADDITVKTWDKNEVYVKAEVSINDGEFDDYFELKVNNGSSFLTIESDYGDLFDRKNKDKESNKNKSWGSCYNLDMDTNYTLYLPKNMSLRVKSISAV